MAEDFSLELRVEGRQSVIKILGLDSHFLSLIPSIFNGEFRLDKFHLVVFGDRSDDDFIINNDNILEYIDEGSLPAIILLLKKYASREFTLNKLFFTINEVNFKYDDDSMLLIKGNIDGGILNLLIEILKKWPPNELLK